MKRFLSLLLVVAMIVSLGVCCIPASAEKADNSLSSIDIAQLVADYGKYLNADTIKAIIGAISDYIGDGNTVNPDAIKVVVAGAADAIKGGIDFDAGNFTKVLASVSGLFSKGTSVDSSIVTTILVAMDRALPVDTSVVNGIITALTGNGYTPPALDVSYITILLNCIGDKALEGIKLEAPTVTNLVKAFTDFKAGGGKLSEQVIRDVVKAMVGNETYAGCRTIICKVTGMYPFSDIANSGYCDAICEAYYLDIVKGYSNGTFKPNQIVSRAQFITMLWRAAGEPSAKGTLTFKDSASIADPYKEAVIWGVTRGVIRGYGDDTFRPNQNISRAQMATFVYRYLKNVQFYDFDAVLPALLFSDSKDIATPYVDAVKAIVSTGIMKGTSPTTFDPNGTANRGMAATVILRTYNMCLLTHA